MKISKTKAFLLILVGIGIGVAATAIIAWVAYGNREVLTGSRSANNEQAFVRSEFVKNACDINSGCYARIIVRHDSLYYVWAYNGNQVEWIPLYALPESTAGAAWLGTIMDIKSVLRWAGTHKTDCFCAFDTSGGNVRCYRHVRHGEKFFNFDVESGWRHIWSTPDSARNSGWAIMVPYGSAFWIDGNLYTGHMATFCNSISYSDQELTR
jgi:hypothetical protein